MSAELELDPAAPADDAKSVDADGLRAMLRRKFPADQYAMLYEVRDAAGFRANRSADVMLIGLWPSRGCLLEGMEIKISRSDWLRELKKPEKAEAFYPFCDHWWIVASDPNIVKVEELPPTWGLMVQRGRGLGVVVQAKPLTPQPVDRSLLAAMLKRATDTAADSPEVRAAIELRIKDATARLEQRIKNAGGYERERAEELKRRIDAFEKASGLKLDDWRYGDVGKLARTIADMHEGSGLPDLAEKLEREANILRRHLEGIESVRTELLRASENVTSAQGKP